MNRSRFKSISLVVLIICTVILGLMGNVVPESMKEKLKVIASFWGLSYEAFWVISIIFLILLVIVLSRIKELADSGKAEYQNKIESKRNQIIENLQKRYNERLTQKIGDRIELHLALKYTKEGTTEEYAETYFARDAKHEKEIRSSLLTVLEKHLHLLIVGIPGVGKTTLLLGLAIDLLEPANRNNSQPFPIIFDLASWRGDQNFFEWLEDGLVRANGFNKRLAREALEERRILPLLDGLDEISNESLRSACLDKIRLYLLSEYGPEKLVICCRIEEYKKILIDAPVRAEVLVKPLLKNQVRTILQNVIKNPHESSHTFANPNAAQNMFRLLNLSSSVANVFCTPFYFNLASEILIADDLHYELPTEPAQLQDHLVEKFINTKLSQPSKRFSSSEKNRRLLSWLASQSIAHNVIELSSFQPSMLRFRIIFNLLIGLWMGFFIGLFMGLYAGLAFGLLFGLSTILIGGLVVGHIMAKDTIRLRLSKILTLDFWLAVLGSGLVVGLFYGLLMGFANYLIFGAGFLYGLWWGLALGFTLAFFYNLIDQGSILDFIPTLTPYQRLKGRLVLEISLSAMLSALLMFFVHWRATGRVAEAVTVAIFAALLMGFGSLPHIMLFKHLILRFCFYLEGSMPLRFVSFLNYATRLRILESDGGQWRFRHKILQDYFATMACVRNGHAKFSASEASSRN